MDTATIAARLRDMQPRLAAEFGVRSLGLFGSRVRSDARADSDIDILVSFRTAPSLLRFVELENLLTDVLGARVDLVMDEALKPAISKRVHAELVSI